MEARLPAVAVRIPASYHMPYTNSKIVKSKVYQIVPFAKSKKLSYLQLGWGRNKYFRGSRTMKLFLNFETIGLKFSINNLANYAALPETWAEC